MSYLLNYSNWRRVFEVEDPAAISNVTSKVGFAGATLSKTTNASALEQLKAASLAGRTIFIKGDNTEIDETEALFRSTDAKSDLTWTIGTKTQTAKNYLKVGDIVINGDSGKPVTMTIEPLDLATKTVEACGNGIYALGRALNIKYNEGVAQGSKLIIGLNTKTANSFVANANTAFQTPVADFTQGAMWTFIVSKAIIPSERNFTNAVAMPVANSKKTDADGSKWTNSKAMPQLSNAYFDELIEISKIDSTAFVETIKNKRITSYTTELEGYVKTYVDTFFEPFLTAYVERFKTFFTKKATEAGTSSTLFSDLTSYIDKWKTDQSAKRDTYSSDLVAKLRASFQAAADSGSVSAPAASAAGKVISGTEGKIGQ